MVNIVRLFNNNNNIDFVVVDDDDDYDDYVFDGNNSDLYYIIVGTKDKLSALNIIMKRFSTCDVLKEEAESKGTNR